ncbi:MULTISPECIES: murein biosynthesis integral membrane protein MurJ [Kribbella]|uniref:Peptidoglycan lipid II flippase n=1 Tax=Kribbella sancticallisti TaxID=460087 RepID=A0ABP4QAC8_9ACTN|nr:murein biosynthesis integral membrane protein MurJ [Kribbella catacumbae]
MTTTDGPPLLRSSAVMAAGTIVSRITGFARNAALVAALGTALLADAYNVANTMPTILYILLLGGALNAVFVPQLTAAARRDPDHGAEFANRLLNAALLFLLTITVASWLLAPQIVDLYSDFTGAQRTLTITFARFFLPQIFFYGLFTMLGQLLNVRGRFGPMMWAPVVNNLVVIGTVCIYLVVASDSNTAAELGTPEIRLLGAGTTAGVIVQALILIPALRATGFKWRPRVRWRDKDLRQIAGLAVWTVLVVVVNQIGYWVVTLLSTNVSVAADRQGIPYGVGYTAYSNAYLLWLIPQGVVTVSMLTALMPRLSNSAADHDFATVRADVAYAVRISATVIVPTAMLFLALGPQIATAAFLRGNVTLQDTLAIGYMLMAFALGLIPFSMQYLLVRVFYALHDTKTPLAIAVATTCVHGWLSIAAFATLPPRWAVTGMAAAYGIAYAVGLAITARQLRARIGDFGTRDAIGHHTRLLLASLVPAAAAYAIGRVSAAWIGHGSSASLLAVAAGSLGFLVLFALSARVLRISEITMLARTARRHVRRLI